MEEMPSLNMPVQRLKVAILPLDLPCSGPVTHSGEILTTVKSHGKKPERFSLNTRKAGYNLLYGSETWTIKASDTRRITAVEMKYMKITAEYTWDRLKNKYTNCKGVKNNTNFVQVTGIQEKLDRTCK